MLDPSEFEHWCHSLDLSDAAQTVIEQIRHAPPSRLVQAGRQNVCGSYPSRKMGLTIQFESHRTELARIYELEHDPTVLEYYDQPPAIELVYASKSGRRTRHQYTPDFFILRSDGATWEECKSESELEQLTQHSPNRYQKSSNERWQCPPGEVYAKQFGLSFVVWSDAVVNWTLQQNLIWLEDYFIQETVVDPQVRLAVLTWVKAVPGVRLATLLEQVKGVSTDDLYSLIATEQIYVDLATDRLCDTAKVSVFSDSQVAALYHHQKPFSVDTTDANYSHQHVEASVGDSIAWDQEQWRIINTGATSIAMMQSNGKLVELPKDEFLNLINQRRILLHSGNHSSTVSHVAQQLQKARPEDIQIANQRYEKLLPYLEASLSEQPSSTLRRWCSDYHKAEKLYGSGYIGLLPKHSEKGNHTPKISPEVTQFMHQFIKDHYETSKQRRVWRVYEAFVEACTVHDPPLCPPSHSTFYHAVQQQSGTEQTLHREGHRAAAAKQPFYWSLQLTTPRHGSRPFELVHIDHTQLDIELVSSLDSLTHCQLGTTAMVPQNLGRPWATFMVDAHSRRLLAVYLTYDEPSYRSCMMAMRICVQRFERLPQIVVVDNGADFHSHYFEQLLAYYICTKKHRPPAMPRYGSLVERLFGTANTQFIHELQGNTQITRQHRQVTASVNPKRLAVWTLSDLYQALCEWAYEIYDQREHPALGQSPRAAFEAGLVIGGYRHQRSVKYDDVFRILTLPAPDGHTRKVQPGRGIQIHNICYWSNLFRDPEVEQSQVEVRYDPFDVSVAYAYVRGQWVKCISAHHQYLQGRSEREIRLVSAELNQRQRNGERKRLITDQALVQFLNSQQAKEGEFLKQRLKTTENQTVIEIAQHGVRPIVQAGSGFAEAEFDSVEPTQPKVDEAPLEYYGEF